MLPSEFLGLPKREKAFIIAAIRIKQEHDKNKAREVKSKGRRK